MVVFERLPYQAGAQFFNELSNSIKSVPMPSEFKTRLKETLISNAFYSTVEFVTRLLGDLTNQHTRY